jgi:hypothetical protein
VNAVSGADQACPYLGLSDDPATHYAFASGAHRCLAASQPITIEPAKQARDCLTSRHITCPLYHSPVVAQPGEGLLHAAVASLALEPVRPGAGVGGAAGRHPPPPPHRVAELVLLAVLMVGAGASAVLLLGSRLVGQFAADPSAAAAPARGGPGSSVMGVTGTPRATAEAEVTPSPASSPSLPTATPAQATAPTAAPAKPRRIVYIVRRGDTLIGIALRYGVPVEALKKANRIPDPNLIFAGQRVVVPLP